MMKVKHADSSQVFKLAIRKQVTVSSSDLSRVKHSRGFNRANKYGSAVCDACKMEEKRP